MDPQRTCIGCRKVKGKDELLRFVLNDNGELIYDPKKRLNGRGTYFCRDKKCITMALKKKRISYSFNKRKVKNYTPGETWDMMNGESF